MQLNDWILAFHLLSAIAAGGAVALFWVLVGQLRRTDLPEVTAGVNDVAKVGTFHAGRMTYDGTGKTLSVRGVLPPFAVTEALRSTVQKPYLDDLAAFEKAAGNATKKQPVSQTLHLPPDFAFPLDAKAQEEQGVRWDAATASTTRARSTS